jgi:hypothetical protein
MITDVKRGRTSRVELVERVKATDSVSNYLVATSYDDEQKIYTLADLSVGVLFEITPLPASVLGDDELHTYSDAIATALSRLPPHAVIQSTVLPASNVDEDVRAYLDAGGDDHPVLASHERMVAQQFKASVTRPLFSFQFGEGGFKTKRYRVLLSVVIRPDEMVGGAKASLFDFLSTFLRRGGAGDTSERRTPAEERYLAMRERLYKNMQEAARRLEGTLRTNHLSVRRLAPTELISFTRMMLWPEQQAGKKTVHDPFQQLAVQMPLGDVAVECSSGSVMSDGWVYKTLSMSSVPRATSPGTTTLPQHALGLFTLLDYIGDGFITVSGHCKPIDDVRNFIKDRKKNLTGGFAMPSKVEQGIKDCDLASFYIETDRRKMFDAQLVIAVRARTEREAQERAEKVRDKAADVGIECRIEQHYAPSLFFQSLPFGFAPTIQEARRLWILPDRALADFMPFFMLSRGTKRPQMMLHNRLGEPFYLNPFDSPTAAHIVICGESGSGKSFFTNYLIFSALRKPDAQVFAIDKGRSYAVATAMLGEKGSYNNMGLSSKTCINAFAGTLESSAAFLRQFIAHLASQVASDRLNSDQMGIVDECITTAFSSKQESIPWKRYEEIHERYPRGAWIDRLRKRLQVHPLDTMQRQSVEQLKARDTGRTPEFELYTQALLLKRTIVDRTSKQIIKIEQYDEVKSVDSNTRKWLETRGFILEDYSMPDGGRQASVLYLSSTQERSLDIDGFEFQALRDVLILEVARREDLRELTDANVRVICPIDYLVRRRRQIDLDIRAEHPGASDEVVSDIVTQRMGDLDPLEYFAELEGRARIQFEVFFSDFVRELEAHKNQALARPIITRLSAYYGNGPLAGFFDGETQFTLADKKLCTFELQELSSAGEHLVAAVVGTLLQMLVLYCQSEHLKGGGPRAYTKYIILDEFWTLLAVPMVADLVINGLRTLRKHNTAIVSISQLVRDFATTERGQVILSSSQHRIFLRQPPDVVAQMDKMLNWSEEQKALMYTVVSAKGLFSEALIDIPNQGISEVARFVPTPYAYWIFTTAPEDVKQRDMMRNEFRAKGYQADDALDMALRECAERWPNGFAAGERKR